MFCFVEPVKNGRLSSPLRVPTNLFNEHGNHRATSPATLSPSPLRPMITTTNINGTTIEQSREVSREREKGPFDYTDLEGKKYMNIHQE